MRISDWSSDVCSSDLLEGHGRRPLDASIDLSRTVGWFTTRYPVVLPTPDDTHDVAGWIVAAKEAMRGIPDDGMTYGMLRYGGHAAAMRAEPSVSFNFVGDINQFGGRVLRSEEQTSELQSLISISYAVSRLKKNTYTPPSRTTESPHSSNDPRPK